MRSLNVVAWLLVIVGALNWGLWGIFQFDLVAALFGGSSSPLSRIVYGLVGLAGAYSLTLVGPLLARTPERAHA